MRKRFRAESTMCHDLVRLEIVAETRRPPGGKTNQRSVDKTLLTYCS
jgi:hypothetical protein